MHERARSLELGNWGQIPTVPLVRCVMLGKSVHQPKLNFFIYKMELIFPYSDVKLDSI